MKYYFLFIAGLLFLSCNDHWLDVKPKKSLVVPKSIGAYQAILDNTNIFNSDNPGILEIASGDYYVSDEIIPRLTATERIAYFWENDATYQANTLSDWNSAYSRILKLNIILEGIEDVPYSSESIEKWENVKGSALFKRAFDHFALAQVFVKPYDPKTIEAEIGLPLRLNANVNEHSERSTLKETYDQIIRDLMEAKDLLPLHAEYKTRPSRVAAFAMLSRVYLVMHDYGKALVYADSCLKNNNTLMDFNEDRDIDTASINPIQRFNKETIYLSRVLNYSSFSPSRLIVDSFLYREYESYDLRKDIFFYSDGDRVRYKGSYDGTRLLFSGLATDEVYLVRAECYARAGQLDLALSDLNTLLSKRIKKTHFQILSTSNKEELLKLILAERRKELVFRTTRWSDLRRLNAEVETQTILVRMVDGQSHTLEPNSKGYTFSIPNQEVLLNRIEQNP